MIKVVVVSLYTLSSPITDVMTSSRCLLSCSESTSQSHKVSDVIALVLVILFGIDFGVMEQVKSVRGSLFKCSELA